MISVVVVFSRLEDAKSMENILMRNGSSVVAVCASGAQALSCMDGLNGGILVSDCRLENMLYRELRECLPVGFGILLVASPARFSGDLPEDLVYPPMPLKIHDLINTLRMMTQVQTKCKKEDRQEPRRRDEREQQLITRAKEFLMERNNMTEAEARRYVQKCSMDSGTNIVEIAQMVMSLIYL